MFEVRNDPRKFEDLDCLPACDLRQIAREMGIRDPRLFRPESYTDDWEG